MLLYFPCESFTSNASMHKAQVSTRGSMLSFLHSDPSACGMKALLPLQCQTFHTLPQELETCAIFSVEVLTFTKGQMSLIPVELQEMH